MLTYENEALLDIALGREYEVVVPRSTILIEPKVLPIDRNIRPQDWDLVQAFLDYLWSGPAQQALVAYYFRPMDPALEERNRAVFTRVPLPFTIRDLGGREKANDEIVNGLWRQVQRDRK